MIDWLLCGCIFGLGMVVGSIGSILMAKQILKVLIRGMEDGLWDG